MSTPPGGGGTVFTSGEISYIAAQRLGRLATVQPSGRPQVNPVSCYYNPDTETIDIGGHNMAKSMKYRNVQHEQWVSVVIDDMNWTNPPQIRCLEIRGQALAVPDPSDTTARAGGAIIRIRPHRIISWGIDSAEDALGARDVPQA